MSNEYELEISKRRNMNLRSMLERWAKAERIDMSVAVALDADAEKAFILVPGASIRGFSVACATGWFTLSFTVRINVCASSEDWRLLYSLLQFLLKHGAHGTDEHGTPLVDDELTVGASVQQWELQFSTGIRVLHAIFRQSDDELASLPNHRFPIPVRRLEVPPEESKREDLERFQALLQTRVSLYSHAREASVIELADGRSLIVWSGDAMLSGWADMVAISEEIDGEPSRILRWDQLVHRASNAIEVIQENPTLYYFRSVDAADAVDAELWQSLVGMSGTLDSLRH